MFRLTGARKPAPSLATRLTATYVFAAIVLVVIVIAAVTTVTLSLFGISSREATAAVVREAPEEARMAIARSRSLDAAAPELARSLTRPGLLVAIFAVGKSHRRLLAATGPDGPDGRPS
jgi:hypothetical protein